MKTIFKSILAVLATVFIASSCSDVPAPYNMPGEGDNGGGSETTSVIFEESFASGQGDFTIKDVKKPTEKPSEVWTYDSYKYMKATAFYNDNGTYINNEAESWLISPEIDLTAYSGDLKLSFDHINRYFANNKTDATVQVTTDGGSTWTQLAVSKYSSGDSWTDWATAECSLTPYAGKKIQFAFKYVSSSTKAGTWELKNVKVETGKAADAENGGGDKPSTGDGEGTKANPYNVASAQGKQDGSKAWLKAYIVGSVKDKSWADDVVFGTESASQTNVIVAASASETDKANCMPIQLPTGAIRSALNLKDNPTLLGKEVLLYGQLTKYFGVPAMKSVTAAIVDGQLVGTDPDAGGETPSTGTYFEETFANAQVQFTIDNKNLGGLTAVWTHDVTYKQMKATAFASGKNHATESWLVSPTVDLSKATSPVLTFDQVVNYFTSIDVAKTEVTVWVQEDGGSWTQATVGGFPTALQWKPWANSTVDLSSYKGKKIKFAFKYTSTADKAGTWEVANVKVAEK